MFKFNNLTAGQIEAVLIKVGGGTEEGVRAFLRDEYELTKVAKAVVVIVALLLQVGTVNIPRTTEKFFAPNKFVVNTEASAKVKISFLGGNFKNYFMDKVEQPQDTRELVYHQLKKNSLDIPIITHLGGGEKVETSLMSVFALMEKQPHGQEGALITNGYANIFYVLDAFEVLRVVYVYWCGGGWSVDAYSIGHPHGWSAGGQVFSANSATV